MRRRTILTAAVSGVAGLSGCLGYTVQSTDEIEQQDQRVENLESTVSEQQAAIDNQSTEISSLKTENAARQERIATLEKQKESLSDRISDLQSQANSLEGENDELQQEIQQLQQEKILVLYQRGEEMQAFAASDWEEGRTAWANDNWGTASMYLFRAEGQYVNTYNEWMDAETLMSEMDATNAASIISDGMSYVEHMKFAANNYANAAYYYSYGEDGQAVSLKQDGDAQYNDAQQYELPAESDIKDALDSTATNASAP